MCKLSFQVLTVYGVKDQASDLFMGFESTHVGNEGKKQETESKYNKQFPNNRTLTNQSNFIFV